MDIERYKHDDSALYNLIKSDAYIKTKTQTQYLIAKGDITAQSPSWQVSVEGIGCGSHWSSVPEIQFI